MCIRPSWFCDANIIVRVLARERLFRSANVVIPALLNISFLCTHIFLTAFFCHSSLIVTLCIVRLWCCVTEQLNNCIVFGINKVSIYLSVYHLKPVKQPIKASKISSFTQCQRVEKKKKKKAKQTWVITDVQLSTSCPPPGPLACHSSHFAFNGHSLKAALPLFAEGWQMEKLRRGQGDAGASEIVGLWIREYRCGRVCLCACECMCRLTGVKTVLQCDAILDAPRFFFFFFF